MLLLTRALKTPTIQVSVVSVQVPREVRDSVVYIRSKESRSLTQSYNCYIIGYAIGSSHEIYAFWMESTESMTVLLSKVNPHRFRTASIPVFAACMIDLLSNEIEELFADDTFRTKPAGKYELLS